MSKSGISACRVNSCSLFQRLCLPASRGFCSSSSRLFLLRLLVFHKALLVAWAAGERASAIKAIAEHQHPSEGRPRRSRKGASDRKGEGIKKLLCRSLPSFIHSVIHPFMKINSPSQPASEGSRSQADGRPLGLPRQTAGSSPSHSPPSSLPSTRTRKTD